MSVNSNFHYSQIKLRLIAIKLCFVSFFISTMGDLFSSTGNIHNTGTNGNGNINNKNAGTANGNVLNTYGSTDHDIMEIWKLYSQNIVLLILFISAVLAIIATFLCFLCNRNRETRSNRAYIHIKRPVFRVPVPRTNRRELIKLAAEPLLFCP
jgi:hypothetical protein